MLTNIMIVEDTETVRTPVRDLLKPSINAVFLNAGDASEGLKVAREHRGPIDLLVSDVEMPGRINGIEMASTLCEAHPETKVVLMSGYRPDALGEKPDWHFIQKPFSATEIRARIWSLLKKYRLAR
jgi:two-component system, cell cycle sensor histidine kinase and response regulator CckA